jgi:hypothetical protein
LPARYRIGAQWATCSLTLEGFAPGAARRAQWDTFSLTLEGFALGAARRAYDMSSPYACRANSRFEFHRSLTVVMDARWSAGRGPWRHYRPRRDHAIDTVTFEAFMFAIQKLEQYLNTSASPAAARELTRLMQALRQEQEFPLSNLYEIDFEAFELAVDVLRDWRIDRYYARDTPIIERLAGGNGSAEPAITA